MKVSLVAAMLVVLVAGCASSGRITPGQRVEVEIIETEYQDCLGGQVALLIDGTDDVPLIVKSAMNECRQHLGRVVDKLRQFGYSPAYASGWIRTVKSQNEAGLTTFVLKMKAQKRASAAR